MEELLISKMQAYLAMISFLEELQIRTNSDDLAVYLGGMDINSFDNKPMDPAMWNDWERAISKVLSQTGLNPLPS